MTTTKKAVLLGYNLKIYVIGGGVDFGWEGIVLGGRGMSKFLAGGEKTPPISQ